MCNWKSSQRHPQSQARVSSPLADAAFFAQSSAHATLAGQVESAQESATREGLPSGSVAVASRTAPQGPGAAAGPDGPGLQMGAVRAGLGSRGRFGAEGVPHWPLPRGPALLPPTLPPHDGLLHPAFTDEDPEEPGSDRTAGMHTIPILESAPCPLH